MDPDEQLCKALLRNAEINPRIPIHKLNEYKILCEKYGYDKQFETIINDRTLSTTTSKVLLPNTVPSSSKVLSSPVTPKIPSLTPKALLPSSPKALLPSSPKALLPSSPKALLPSSPKALLPSSPKALLPIPIPKLPSPTSKLPSPSKILLPGSPIKQELLSSSPTNKELPVELPRPLWNWKVEENKPPIPIKYPVERQFNILLIEEWRRSIAELSLIDQNLKNFDTYDLIKLFDLYNLYFFNNSLPPTKLEISTGLTVTAGVCKISRTSTKCDYNITISKSIFTKLNLEENQGTKSGGLVCKSRLNCLQLVLEHEIIHLISGFYYPNKKELNKKIYSSHGLLFKNLVKNYFGQTESTHQIGNIIYDGSDKERILSKEEIIIGRIVAFIDKKGIKKGVITNIYNKNVGVKFLDDDSWKVGSEFLHKVSKDDDDYDSLLDIKNELLSKLKLYQNIKIGDTVKFYFNKEDIFVGTVSKLNNKSSKLSIVVGTSIYTIIYSYLIEIMKTTNTIKTQAGGTYTIKDFKIGDKVIIAGGKRSNPTYGTIIKLNRVNAKIKENNSETTWNANYSILSFQ
jgi:hypothetical protein